MVLYSKNYVFVLYNISLISQGKRFVIFCIRLIINMNFSSIGPKSKFFNLDLKFLLKVFAYVLWIFIIVLVFNMIKLSAIRARVQGFCTRFFFFLSLQIDFINQNFLVFFYISRFKIYFKIKSKSSLVFFF